MRTVILDHHTSFKAATSILWNNIIYGSSLSGPWSHERRPHFFVHGHTKGGMYFPETEEIILQFDAQMLLQNCRDNHPIPNRVNIHRHVKDRSFFEATIYEGQSIVFLGATDLTGRQIVKRDCGSTLYRLIERNKGFTVSTGARQEGKSNLPQGPTILEEIAFPFQNRRNKKA